MSAIADAFALHRQGRLAEAEAAYRDALTNDPSPLAQCGLGILLFERGDIPGAMAVLQAACAQAPNLVEAVNSLACCHQRQGDIAAAVALLRRAIALRPDFAEALSNFGAVLRDDDRLAAARLWLWRSLTIDANAGNAWRNCANLARDLKDGALEIQAHVRAARLFPPPAPAATAAVYAWALAATAGRPAVKPAVTPIDIPDTTLVFADTINHGMALAAARHTMALCRFAKAIFLTDRPFDLPGLDFRRVPAFDGSPGYSRFIMKELWRQVDTPYVLIAQHDGFVIDPGAWQAHFQAADYIGAVWPQFRDGHNVGNGGFSLRSRRLLEALRDDAYVETHPEDLAICRLYRRDLERRHGIRFADPTLAAAFAQEAGSGRAGGQSPFGFHDFGNLASLVATAETLAVLLDLISLPVYRSRQPIHLGMNFLRDGRPALAAQLAKAVLARVPDHSDAALLRRIADQGPTR